MKLSSSFLTIILVASVAWCAPARAGDRSWQHYGGDVGGKRFSPHAQINVGNVATLHEAWRFRSGDLSDGSRYPKRSSFKATPIYFEGRLYLSTGFNRVFALEPASGETVWVFDPKVDFSIKYAEMFTSRGVAAWRDDRSPADQACARRIFLGTLDARLIALDAQTGRPCAAFGRRGSIDLSRGIKNFRRGEYSLTSPVTVVNDVVVAGSSIGDNGGVELDHGVVRGFDARSGALLWSWDPIPRNPEAPGAATWAGDSASRTGAANVWSIMSAAPEHDLVFLPTTSPSPDFYGGERVGDNLFSGSTVALRASSGRMLWHFQTVHHDLWDYDVASQPAVTIAGPPGKERPAIVQATKIGHVFVLDLATGEPLFGAEERAVPQTDVPGEATSKTQPFPLAPAPLHPQTIDPKDVWEYSAEQAAYCRSQLARLRFDGVFTPPSLAGTLVYPGNAGGTNWGSVAVDETRHLAVMAVNRMPTIVTLIPRADFERRRRAERADGVQFTSQRGTPFGMKRHGFYDPQTKMPCLRGPWGTLVALDLVSGDKRWETPIGTYPELRDHSEASGWGTHLSGGPVLTAGGLSFIATRADRRLYALDSDSGRVRASLSLPAGAHATPMSYRHADRQYIVVAAGGEQPGTDMPGDYLVAFALPQ